MTAAPTEFQNSLTELEKQIWFGFLCSHWDINREIDALLRSELGISFGDHLVLFSLVRRGGGPTRLTELAADTRITISGVSRMVASLEKRGFVERKSDPADARASLVTVTTTANDELQRLEPHIAAIVRRRFLDHFTEDELQHFSGYLGRITT